MQGIRIYLDQAHILHYPRPEPGANVQFTYTVHSIYAGVALAKIAIAPTSCPMKQTALFTPVLIAGCIIVMLSFAVRASFGVFQIPVAEEFGWLRSEFSMAIALQNLFWGIGQPIFGAIADKVTDRKAIILGGLV